jgi:S-(hydroxymethyl)glutathione dehydrogenase / alcohol dehydrogenase
MAYTTHPSPRRVQRLQSGCAMIAASRLAPGGFVRAAICHEFRSPLVIDEVTLREPAADEVAVRVAACAICHSDISFIDGFWQCALPAVFGHEAAGVVESTGPGVTGVAAGDHVVVAMIRACGHCRYCARGDHVLCITRFPLDESTPLRGSDGQPITHGLRTAAFAERVVVHASQVVAIPAEVPMTSACLLACGALTGVGAVVNTARMPAGSHAVIVGAGGVGLNSVQGAALSGARTIIAIDPVASKRDAARRLGATDTIDPDREDARRVVRGLTDGGADYVFVTVGSKQAFDAAQRYAGRGGTVVVVGIAADGVRSEFDPGALTSYNQRIIGSKLGSARLAIDVPILVDLYQQGRLVLDELVTRTYPLDAINDAIAAARAGEVLRAVITL